MGEIMFIEGRIGNNLADLMCGEGLSGNKRVNHRGRGPPTRVKILR